MVLHVRVSLHETRTRDMYRPTKRRVAITELPSVLSQKTNVSFFSQDESIFWDLTPCSARVMYRRFRGIRMKHKNISKTTSWRRGQEISPRTATVRPSVLSHSTYDPITVPLLCVPSLAAVPVRLPLLLLTWTVCCPHHSRHPTNSSSLDALKSRCRVQVRSHGLSHRLPSQNYLVCLGLVYTTCTLQWWSSP